MRMIDSHVHVVSADQTRYPRRAPNDMLSAHVSREIAAEELLTYADQESIERIVLVQAFATYGFDNAYIIDVANQHPDRFAFVSGVNPEKPDAREQSNACLKDGARGLRALAFAEDFDAQSLRALLEPASEVGAAICLLATPQVLTKLAPVLIDYPNVPFVLDHCGLQPLDSSLSCLGAPALFALASLDNIVLKVSSRVFSKCLGDEREVIRSLVSEFGAERLMWGSDFPASSDASYSAAAKRVVQATSNLTSTDREQILHGTSEQVFWRSPQK